jgi:hypothetical protein
LHSLHTQLPPSNNDLTDLEDNRQELLLPASNDVIELADDDNIPSLHQLYTSPASELPTMFACVERERLERTFIGGTNKFKHKQNKPRVFVRLPLPEWRIHSWRDLEPIGSSALSPGNVIGLAGGGDVPHQKKWVCFFCFFS